MYKSISFLALILSTLLLLGCSSSNIKDDLPIIFNSLTANKVLSFTDESITLDIDGEQFEEVIVTSSNPNIVITKTNKTTYKVSSLKALNATINVKLINNSHMETKSVSLSFYQHGVQDFEVVEGIKIKTDTTEKILNLIGEPEGKSLNSDESREFWFYFTQGFQFTVIKATNTVDSSVIFPTSWNRTVNNVSVTGDVYPYDIDITNNWNVANGKLIMDEVIEKLGQPKSKFNSNTASSKLKRYLYSNPNAMFFFYSDNLDDYSNKSVSNIVIY